MTGRVAAPRAAVVAHPRHLVLAALVGGLIAGTRWPAAVAAGVAILGMLAMRLRGRRCPAESGVTWRWSSVLAAAAAAVLGGAVVAAERLDALDRTVLVPTADASVVGYVTDAPRERAFGVRVVPVRLTAGEGRGELVQLRLAAWVRWPRDARIGDEVAAQGRLRALRPRETFERRRHVHAVLEADRVTATGRSRGSPIDAIRERAERSLSSGMRPEQAALARGMVLGQDHALPADLRDAFRASGLAHLVAASGSNVMLLVALVIALSVVAGVPLRRRLALALAAVVLYVPLAGAGPSIQRAGVMGAAGLIAALAGRPASRWYALLLAAAATLAHDPSAAEEPGWQLSFAAVIAILALYRPVRGWLVAHRVPGALAEATALTTAATAGTAPLLSMHFGELSLVSLPANVLAAPAVAPVMWLGAGAAVLGGDAARVLDALCAYPLAYLAWLGRTAASLPHASVAAELPGPVAAAAAYALVGGLWLAPPRVRRAALGGCALLAAVALGLAPGPPGPPAGFAVSFLDVGQGDATLVQHGDHAVLVDTGPPGAPVLDRLRSAGVRRLDALVLTHPQADHDGNAERVLAALPTELLLDGSGRVRAPAGVSAVAAEEGQVVRAGPLRVRVLWPPAGRAVDDPNDAAVVALVEDGPHTALLTADAESGVTLPLDLPEVDVLKVAHHGSDDPGLPQLLERLRPTIAVIPVGRNSYGHPAPSTLAALRGVPEVLRTDRDGTVRLTPRGSDLASERVR